MRFFFALLIGVLAVPLAQAMQLTVIVLEKGSGLPVEAATVVLADTGEYETSDQQGNVQFNSIEKFTNLKILAAGFEELVVQTNGSVNPLRVYLEPIAFEGQGIEVVADRLPEKVSKIALTAEELVQAPGSQGDPIMVTQSLPGVVSVADGTGLVYMRGSDLHDNISVVDRVPIGYLYHFGGFRSTINPRMINDLNVFLGGFPVEYGDALGGVLDVHLRAPNAEQRRYYYNISTIEANVSAEGPVDWLSPDDSFIFAARRSYYDLLFSPSEFNDAFSDGEDGEDTNQVIAVPRYHDIQGLYRHPTVHGEIDFYYYAAADKLVFDIREGEKKDPQLRGEISQGVSYHTLGATWRTQLSNNQYLDMPIATFATQEKLSLGTDEIGDPFFVNTNQRSYMLRPKITLPFENGNQFLYGLDATYFDIPIDLYISRLPLEDDIDFQISDKPKYRLSRTIHAHELAPYVQYRYRWSDDITTTAGLRYTDIRGSGGIDMQAYSPRVALEYQAGEHTLLMASWGKYVQLPLGFSLLQGFGNPYLEFTEAEHRIIGIQQQLNTLWSVNVEAYHKPMKNLVVPLDEREPPENYANLGEGESYGLDVYLKRQARNGRLGWLSYSYARSKRFNPLKAGDGNRNFSGDQPHTLTLVWGEPFSDGLFDWMKDWKRWHWELKIQWHSGLPYTSVEGFTTEQVVVDGEMQTRLVPRYGRHNGKRLPNFFQVDLRIERGILHESSKAKMYLEIINVTNRKNVKDYDVGEEYENLDNPDEVTGLPFVPSLGFEMEF